MAAKNSTTTDKIITYAGLKKLEDELTDLKVVKRREIAEKIKEARELGDLSENAEYHAAKEEQGKIESRIEEIEEMLKHIQVVDDDEISNDKVNVGCDVKLSNTATKEQCVYTIVGTTEANFLENKISNESPLGHELIGKKVGAKVVVKAPSGDVTYKILEIKKSE